MSSTKKGQGTTPAPPSVPDVNQENKAVINVTGVFSIANKSASLLKARYVTSDDRSISYILLLDKQAPETESRIEGVKYLGLNQATAFQKIINEPFLLSASPELKKAQDFYKIWSGNDYANDRFVICADQGLSCPALVCMQLAIEYQHLTAKEALAAVVAARPDIHLPSGTISVLKKAAAGSNDKSLNQLPDDFFTKVSDCPNSIKVSDKYILYEEGRKYIESILKGIERHIGAFRKVQVMRASENAEGEIELRPPSTEPSDDESD